jgi:hypothetical protein
MKVWTNKISLKKLVGMAGIVSFSVLLGLPGLAQTMSENERNNICGGYEGNGTSGGGYYCAMKRQNSQFPNRGADSEYRRTPPQGSSFRDNGGSTTGAGYPGNNVTPQGVDERSNQDSPNPGSNMQNGTSPDGSSSRENRDNGGSTTGAGYPGNNVTPQGVDNMNR